MEKENILSELRKNIQEDKFIKIVFSDRQNGEFNKIIIKSLSLKNGKNIQIESFKDNKAFHKNIELDNFQEIEDILKGYMENFKQILLQIENLDISFIKKKENFVKKENKNNLIKNYIEHNKKKQYILNEGDKIDFLIELGLMSTEGKILKSSYNKFRQINKYLEFIDDVIEELKSKKLIDNHINVLDFGCGKSYLTFALYYYLKNYRKDLSFSIVGLDLKKDVIEFCNKLAQKLDYKSLEFLNGNIKDYDRAKEVDLVFSLHACNNATDYSLEKALSLNAKAILAVPCCHHEFFEKIQKNKNSKNVFSGITTREELKIFYYENLTYDRNDDKKRESIVKKYTKADFQEMFRILFATETNETKDKIFSDIQYFYDSLERSKRI